MEVKSRNNAIGVFLSVFESKGWKRVSGSLKDVNLAMAITLLDKKAAMFKHEDHFDTLTWKDGQVSRVCTNLPEGFELVFTS